ncbi:MAG: hypothetical protein IPH34_10635 [Chitinophagaceae bacterium]|nr:hypothetical protein [Chitinophagaceae bacterium]MBK8606965.1 hypothetical protein [Chitinophagaceae bacterium]MBP6478180.1 hypothetical protein [Chitinophagaceae bacterium]MBP7107839.1 hypothetical protein [Chitinophagaceae bacterium]MBP7314971.1 hypothetical protein [Chitinophagaceae bacterium]
MKRNFLIAVLLSLTFNAFSQEDFHAGGCTYLEKTKLFIKSVDSLSDFFQNIKSAVSVNEWNGFIADANAGSGLSSFNNFSSNSSQFQNEYDAICKSMVARFDNLKAAIDPGGTMDSETIKQVIGQDIRCYLKDTLENTMGSRFSSFGLGSNIHTTPIAGPCERDLRTCGDNAQNAYTQNIMACGFGGATVGGLVKGGWWGIGAGFICFVVASARKNNALGTCIENYVDCMN